MNTRKYSRTMRDAFGPYTDDTLYPMDQDDRDWQDTVVLWGCGITALLVAMLVLSGVIV